MSTIVRPHVPESGLLGERAEPLGDDVDVFTADWTRLLVGVRTGPQIQVLAERYPDTGQMGFVCWWRGDVGVARPEAFALTVGVLP